MFHHHRVMHFVRCFLSPIPLSVCCLRSFSYPEQRTIVRQDERASCFYIILSGSAIPTCKRASNGNLETLDILKRGATFGVRNEVESSFSDRSPSGERSDEWFNAKLHRHVENTDRIVGSLERRKSSSNGSDADRRTVVLGFQIYLYDQRSSL